MSVDIIASFLKPGIIFNYENIFIVKYINICSKCWWIFELKVWSIYNQIVALDVIVKTQMYVDKVI